MKIKRICRFFNPSCWLSEWCIVEIRRQRLILQQFFTMAQRIWSWQPASKGMGVPPPALLYLPSPPNFFLMNSGCGEGFVATSFQEWVGLHPTYSLFEICYHCGYRRIVLAFIFFLLVGDFLTCSVNDTPFESRSWL